MNLILTCLVLLSASFDTPKDPKTVAELKQLAGTWKYVDREANGAKTFPESVERMTITVVGSEMTMADGAGGEIKAEVTLDLSANPKRMIIASMIPGRQEPINHYCIYKLEKDELVICMTVTPGQYAKEFDSAGGFVLIKLKRAKP